MLTLKGTPPELADLYKSYKIMSEELFQQIRDRGESKRFPADSDLLAHAAGQGDTVFISDGYFKLKDGEKVIRLYSNGDFVNAVHPMESNWSLTSDLAAEVTRFQRRDFLSAIQDNPASLEQWITLQDLDNKINLYLCSLYMEEDVTADFVLREYNEGDRIITEGDEPFEIFEMISGSALVLCDGKEIGSIDTGELFGEISFLTGSVRTATVQAAEKCLVRVADKDSFLQLVKCNPQLIMSISKTLAQRVIRMNERMVG